MAGSIADFKSSFISELARPNKFDVFIPIPTGINKYGEEFKEYIGFDNRIMTLRCESADLPGISFATTSQKIYGPEEKYPYQTTFNDINLTFICTDDMKEKTFFDHWLKLINPYFYYNIEYKDQYKSDIEIRQYDMQNQESYIVTLVDAFPIGMNDIQLDWSSDGYHKLTVVFSFTYWKNRNPVKEII